MVEQNKKNIRKAKKMIESIELEDLAENLYNASLSNYMWRGRYEYTSSHYPFYIDHRGTHADYEIIIPNVHEVYNVSDERIKKKMVDSVAWVIDNHDKEIRVEWNYQKNKQDYEKISIYRFGSLLDSFSGNENYPLDLHEFEKRPYLLKEDSSEIKDYIKNKLGSSLLNFRDKNPDMKDKFYLYINPMGIFPLDVWKEGVRNGYGAEILLNKLGDNKSFFGERKNPLGIEKLIRLGMTPEQNANLLRKYEKHGYFGMTHFQQYLDIFKSIKDESTRKAFMEVLDNAIENSEYCVREGDEIKLVEKNKKENNN